MSEELQKKLDQLHHQLAQYTSAVIAFSGGVDSTYLAAVTGDRLNGHVLLVTATSATYPASELDEAKALAGSLNLAHRVIVSEEIEIPGFSDNPPDRCYYCKSELFSKITAIARAEGYDIVCDGSNADDLQDFRPGRRAICEQKVISPLLDAGLTKNEIRALSAQRGLATAVKGSFACLASRFPYGETIDREKLKRVGTAEAAVRALGFVQVRVRSHGNLARIEFAPDELQRGWTMKDSVDRCCREAGFIFVAIDTRGYRTGAMNEALPDSITAS